MLITSSGSPKGQPSPDLWHNLALLGIWIGSPLAIEAWLAIGVHLQP